MPIGDKTEFNMAAQYGGWNIEKWYLYERKSHKIGKKKFILKIPLTKWWKQLPQNKFFIFQSLKSPLEIKETSERPKVTVFGKKKLILATNKWPG